MKIDVDEVSAQDALNAISSATTIINKKLKMIAAKVGIEKNISTHVASHSVFSFFLKINSLQNIPV
mgnify:CR=1 FL=1